MPACLASVRLMESRASLCNQKCIGSGHVVRMGDEKITKVLMYSQLVRGHKNVVRQRIGHKDKIMGNFLVMTVAHNTFGTNKMEIVVSKR